MKIFVTVILYNPDGTVWDNIFSYSNTVDTLYIIDNSTKPISRLDEIRSQSNIKYISMHGNQGIAAALNMGARQAMKDGAKYLMTMDQDSRFDPETFKGYIAAAEKIFDENQKVAVTGINYDGYIKKNPNADFEIADELITSGMIIKLEIMKKLGPFVDKLFIDYVDYDYCYRARENGYLCVMINKYRLQHQIGGMNPVVKFGIHFRNHNEHNWIRQYYMARNAIYIMKKYPCMGLKWIKNLVKAPIKIMLVDDDKWGKFKGYICGLLDGLMGNYGPK